MGLGLAVEERERNSPSLEGRGWGGLFGVGLASVTQANPPRPLPYREGSSGVRYSAAMAAGSAARIAAALASTSSTMWSTMHRAVDRMVCLPAA